MIRFCVLLRSISMLTIDHRERKIKDAFDGTEGVDYLVKELPVGDFMVSYDDSPEKMWLCERKTGTDLSASIKSGRWRDQLARLYETGHRVVVMIEGDLRNAGLPQKSLMGAWINASMRKRFTVYRTADVWESALLLKTLVEKMRCWGNSPPISSGLVVSKRKRDADNCHLRMCAVCRPSLNPWLMPCSSILVTCTVSKKLCVTETIFLRSV